MNKDWMDDLLYPPACRNLDLISGGKIRWVAFSTGSCNYCQSKSTYESAQGALCSDHAKQYASGKITIPRVPSEELISAMDTVEQAKDRLDGIQKIKKTDQKKKKGSSKKNK